MLSEFPGSSNQYFAQMPGHYLSKHFFYMCRSRQMIQRRELGYVCMILNWLQYFNFYTFIFNISFRDNIRLFCFWFLPVILLYMPFFNTLPIMLNNCLRCKVFTIVFFFHLSHSICCLSISFAILKQAMVKSFSWVETICSKDTEIFLPTVTSSSSYRQTWHLEHQPQNMR